MQSTQTSSQTFVASLSPKGPQVVFDLKKLPAIFVSLSGFVPSAAAALEDRLRESGARLTYDVTEARIILVNVDRKRRAQFDLRGQGLVLEEGHATPSTGHREHGPPKKRRRLDSSTSRPVESLVSSTESETENEADLVIVSSPTRHVSTSEAIPLNSADDVLRFLQSSTVKVIKATWMENCISSGTLCRVGDALLMEGSPVAHSHLDAPPTPKTPTISVTGSSSRMRKSPASQSPEAIIARAKADNVQATPGRYRDFGARRFGDSSRSLSTAPFAAGAQSKKKSVQLLERTTSEYGGDVAETQLPPQPEWVVKHVLYACQRPTPDLVDNREFLDLLKEIRLARLLTADEIGVRAYSTSIASIAAYPIKLTSAKEVLNLPGCDVKIANLWVEYANTGGLAAAQAAKDDAELNILRLFYDIWGVGATTARDFFYERGWRDLDDVVEFGWSTLSRVQQIGVKYYDEFKSPIPRSEVEAIASIIHSHAVKVRDGRIQSLVVGGYRRGKKESGDVDLLVSHPDANSTRDLVTDIVTSLEEEGWITHTLLLALTSTHREQQTLPFRATRGRDGPGFDTLDKALVVWQDPGWPSKNADLEADPNAKNPAPHRRVDIIISPWRTVGCAVAGWSGGTTFQRDLRRYAKKVKVWKFDSSGVRDRGNGMVVDVEGFFGDQSADHVDEGRGVISLSRWKERAQTMEEAEKRVFQGMGLEWLPPEQRCTG